MSRVHITALSTLTYRLLTRGLWQWCTTASPRARHTMSALLNSLYHTSLDFVEDSLLPRISTSRDFSVIVRAHRVP